MSDKQILIGRDGDGSPIILNGNPVTIEDGDTLSLAPLLTHGWRWTLEFLDRAKIDETQLPAEEIGILIGGSPFTESEYSSEDPGTGDSDPSPVSAEEEVAEQLEEVPNLELIEDNSGDFEEGVFVYQVAAANAMTISGRVRRIRRL